LVFHKVTFHEPLYVDLRTGKVYQIPKTSFQRDQDAWKFSGIPCYDSPILIADRATLPLNVVGQPGTRE
jgi:hypothetical protein